MKTLVLVIIFLVSGNFVRSEDRKYFSDKCHSTKSQEIVTISPTTISINDTQIRISGLNGKGILTIEEIKEKDYKNSLATWYYCTSQYQSKFTVIIPKTENPSKIDVYQNVDELTIIHQEYSLQNDNNFGKIIPVK